MPKLRPGLEHVGEARPESELPKHEEPARRDGQPRTYPAHWGPEAPSQRSAPHAAATHPQRPAGMMPGAPAGLWARFFAAIIDRIVLSFVVGLGFMIFGGDTLTMMQDWLHDVVTAAQNGASQTPDMPGPLQTALLVITLATAAGGFLYDALMTAFCHGRTIGRMALGVAVVPAATAPDQVRTARVPLAKALIRSVVKWGPSAISSIGELLEIVVFFSALTNSRRAGIHDRLAGTEVRRTR